MIFSAADRAMLARIECNQAEILARLRGMSKPLDDLTAQVTANTNLEQSAITLIQGLAAQLAAAGTDPVKLTALHDQLATSATALAAAITANTPVAPAAPSAPTP